MVMLCFSNVPVMQISFIIYSKAVPWAFISLRVLPLEVVCGCSARRCPRDTGAGPHPGSLNRGAVSGAWEELWVWLKLLGSKSGSLYAIGQVGWSFLSISFFLYERRKLKLTEFGREG